MTPVTYHMTALSSILNMEKPETVFEKGIIMRFIKSIPKKIVQFLRHLSREYAHPSFYVAKAREAQRKKEQTCCEASEVIRRHQLW
jgi:hypothetical protein